MTLALGLMFGLLVGGGCGEGAGGGGPELPGRVGPEISSQQTDAGGAAEVRGESAADGGATAGGSCLAGEFLAQLGFNRLLVGGDFSDAVAGTAPFDLRYHYLAGGISAGDSVCGSCRAACAEAGQDWWGCWQDPALPPGDYVRTFVSKAADQHQLPLLTYYQQLQAAGTAEGAAQLVALRDPRFMRRYLADFRFLLENVGGARVLLHLEPDLWGYLQRVNPDPRAIPVAVSAGADCGDLEDHAAGLGACLVRMVRRYAPHAKVGLHASGWATGTDALYNRDPAHDVRADAVAVARFLGQVAPDADFVVVDPSDRDAGYFQSVGIDKGWDPSNRTLPHFQQAFDWTEALTTQLQKPALWWQLPLGHQALPNTPQRWRDNRVQTLFDSAEALAGSNTFGMVFGAGREDQTSPSTDDGHFAARVRRYVESGGVPACR